jgi:2'-5' RNA ligase
VNGGPFPHFLVLFDRQADVTGYARAHADFLGGFRHLSVIPEAWLHSTILGVHHVVSPSQMEQLRSAARRELRTMRPFSVQLGPTWPGVTAVTAAIYPETGMTALAERIQIAASSVPGVTLPTSEGGFWPHVSLCYARASSTVTADRALNRGLRRLRPARVEATIDRVHLVSQRQDPVRGFYTWERFDEFPLGERG